MASIELGIPLSETQFEHWPPESAIASPSDNTILNALHLPHFNSLNVKVHSPLPGVSVGLDQTDKALFDVPCSALK